MINFCAVVLTMISPAEAALRGSAWRGVPSALEARVQHLPGDLTGLHQSGDAITAMMQGGSGDLEREVLVAQAPFVPEPVEAAPLRPSVAFTPSRGIASVPVAHQAPSAERSWKTEALLIALVIGASGLSWMVLGGLFSNVGFNVNAYYRPTHLGGDDFTQPFE